jgi:hypothetical protein
MVARVTEQPRLRERYPAGSLACPPSVTRKRTSTGYLANFCGKKTCIFNYLQSYKILVIVRTYLHRLLLVDIYIVTCRFGQVENQQDSFGNLSILRPSFLWDKL